MAMLGHAIYDKNKMKNQYLVHICRVHIFLGRLTVSLKYLIDEEKEERNHCQPIRVCRRQKLEARTMETFIHYDYYYEYGLF